MIETTWMAAARSLERYLGDPHDERSAISYAGSLALDEGEEFPADACARLAEWGYTRELVPEACGGALASFDRLLTLGRIVARRDLTVAIATGQTLLGALPVWLEGDGTQRAGVAALVASGSAGCLALTEEEHGSDLSAGEVRADLCGAGWVLSGTKWCINNATRGGFVTVLARTSAEGGLRGHSLFVVDKREVAPDQFAPLPRLRTHGIRGADISGIRFDRTRLGAGAVVGRPGGGLNLTLKTLQISRTMCSAFSLGAADSALRLALDFARGRALYGRTAYEIPAVRRAIADAFADLLLVDALAQVTSRALSILPEQMSVLSSVTKYLVPTMMDDLVREMAVLLGARHYLREGRYATFQKLARDHGVVGLFDGSTAVNLYVLSTQLPRIADARLQARGHDERLDTLLDLGAAAPPFDWSSLRPSARGHDSLLSGLEHLTSRVARGRAPTELSGLGLRLIALRDDLDRDATAHAAAPDYRQDDARSFALAKRYCLLCATAAALGVWVTTRDRMVAPLAGGEWLVVALSRVVGRLDPSAPQAGAGAYEATSAAVLALQDGRQLFSLVPVELGS